MYLQLFRRTEQAIRILEQAQREAEAQYMAGAEPPLHLTDDAARKNGGKPPTIV